jgi:signal transduction histidine kinase
MQLVSDSWYDLFNRIATSIAITLLIICGVVWIFPGLREQQAPWGFTFITFMLAGLQLSYRLFFYKKEVAESGKWSATFFLFLFQALIAINLVHTTGELRSIYMFYWLALVLASGIFGLYAVIGAAFVTTLYFVLTTADRIAFMPLDPFGTFVLLVSYIAGVLGYLFWQRFYVSKESARITELSGIVKSKQQQSEVLMHSLADGVIVTNTEGKISLINPTALKMTERKEDETLDIDVNHVLKLNKENGAELPEEENPFKKVLQTKKAVTEVLELIGIKGKRQVVSLVISPVMVPKSDGIAGAVGVMRDITASRAEEKRRADFISTASHEMRTPVAAIEGYLALALNEHVSKVDQKAREYLEKAHSSTQHLGKLFQDLLTSAKAEDGRLVNNPVVINMGEFLEQLTDSLRFSAEKKGLFMEFIIGTSSVSDSTRNKVVKPLYYVHADPDRMREVIINIFDNAVKYTENGKVTLGLTGNNDIVQFYIKDTGPGIAPENIPHLFQKFYRIDNTATRTIGGTGLGLFISRKIVELYNGRIWVDSQPDKGSTFYINLPRLSSQKVVELQAKEVAEHLSPLQTITTS